MLREGATANGDDLITHCKADLAPFKVPRQIEIRGLLKLRQPGRRERLEEFSEVA